MGRTVNADHGGAGERARALLGLIDETVAFFLRLQKDVQRTLKGGELAGARRTLLLELYRGGPSTVPQMARARGVSRQYIQMVVNPLAEQEQLEFVENPAHKRSRLVRLTALGKAMVEELTGRELAFLRERKITVEKGDLMAAADTLRQVRELMESEQWRQAMEGNIEGK